MRLRLSTHFTLLMTVMTLMSLLVGPYTIAQPREGSPRFDVASVKVDNGAVVFGVTGQMLGGPGSSDPGRLTITQRGMKIMIQTAYGVGLDQIYGPAWLDDTPGIKYTVSATLSPNATKDQFQLMFQNFLADRFHLVAHHETKAFPGYELVIAPGGLKIKEWSPNQGDPPGRGGRDDQGFRILTGNNGYVVTYPQPPGTRGIARVSSRLSMSDFAKHLGALVAFSNAAPAGVETPRVVDKTGLAGTYDLKLGIVGMTVLLTAPPSQPSSIGDALPTVSDQGENGDNLFTALEKQVGLRLVKTNGVPVDVLVIDRVDKIPTEN